MEASFSSELIGYVRLIDAATTLSNSPCLSTDIQLPDMRTDTAPVAYCRDLGSTDKEVHKLFDLSGVPQDSDAFFVYNKLLNTYAQEYLSLRQGTQKSILWGVATVGVWEKVQWLQEVQKLKHSTIKASALHLSASEISKAAAGMVVIPLPLVEKILREQFEHYWPRSKDFFIAYTCMRPSDPEAEKIAEWRCRRFTEVGVIAMLTKRLLERTDQHVSLIFLATCANLAMAKVSF